jgi:hypothetical protein
MILFKVMGLLPDEVRWHRFLSKTPGGMKTSVMFFALLFVASDINRPKRVDE